MPKRLSITISGAVSLGSYEAGVLYEVLQAVAAQNRSASSEDGKIYIDVVTGASAGGMCAAILAQKLLYDGDALAGADSNALHDPWIVDVSLTGLLGQQPDEDPSKSMLSSDLVEAISQKYITGRYASGLTPPAPNPHPAIDPTRPLRLGLALSNLDGVDYWQAQLTGGKFVYTRYQDEFRRVLAPGAGSDTLATWEEIRQAAVACGAFPYAFRVRELQRQLSDYPDTAPGDFPPLGMRFAYTDGGVFQNEPLGMAKDFVDQIDNHLGSESRFYLYIAPGARSSSISDPADLVTGANANFLVTTKGLVGAVFNQARFHDWIMAEKVNQDVSVFNRRALQLQADLMGNGLVVGTIAQAATAYIVELQRMDPALTDALVADATDRLRVQFQPEYDALAASAGGTPAAEAWLRSILVLELAADLAESDEMYILSVTATDSELAGSSLEAFAGFFDQGIRQHDYDVGRNKAKAFIAGQNAAAGPTLGPFAYDPGAPLPLDPAYNGFDVSKLPTDERQSLKDRACDRIDTMLGEAGVPWIIRKPLMAFYVSGKVGSFLGL